MQFKASMVKSNDIHYGNVKWNALRSRISVELEILVVNKTVKGQDRDRTVWAGFSCKGFNSVV